MIKESKIFTFYKVGELYVVRVHGNEWGFTRFESAMDFIKSEIDK